MRYIKTNHWTDKSNQQGLLFFSQILTEALFDYSLDSYKPQALNVRLLCVEAVQTIDNIKKGLIKKPNIESIIEELIWNLENDFTSKSILKNKLLEVIAKINANRQNLKRLRDTIQYLYHFYDNRKYLDAIKKSLIDLIPANKEKKNIYSLTRAFLTELINYGYTTGYIYHNTNKYFYDFNSKVTTDSPADFLNFFNFERKKYSVIYKAHKVFTEFESVGKGLNFRIANEYTTDKLFGEEKAFIDNKGGAEVFIVFPNVEAVDNNAARIHTMTIISTIGNLFSFYHHKEIPRIHNLALVINETDDFAILTDEPIKSIIKKADIKPIVAAEKVEKLLSTLKLPESTTYRIAKAIDLHSIALSTNQIENKLLNLWTAIETLIPKDIDCGDDRIVQIVRALSPFQTLNYINKLLIEVGRDFWHYNRRTAKEVFDTIILKAKENKFHRLAALIMTQENEEKRKEVYSKLDNFPLLRFRLFNLNKTLSNSKESIKLIETHRKRVEWQIRRIYRVRNLIVHSGQMPSYANVLVENLHNYFDDFLNYIIDSAIEEKRIKTINEAIINAEIDCSLVMNELKSLESSSITLENYKKVL